MDHTSNNNGVPEVIMDKLYEFTNNGQYGGFILAYVDPQYDFLNPVGHTSEKINFYIDPINGQMYSHKDVENYFKRINVPQTASYFRQLSNKRIIQFLLEELSKCFDNDRNRYKMEELLQLAKLLSE